MSPQDSSIRKRTPDIYTVMLFIAALALLIGCIVLYTELHAYGPFLEWWKPTTGGGGAATTWVPAIGDLSRLG